jgi:hypothetical protein
MYDYDAEYRRLRAAGLPGWAGNQKPLTDLACELMDSGFDVQDTSLSVNPWWDHVTMTCRISAGQHSSGACDLFPLPLAVACGGGCRAQRGGWGLYQRARLLLSFRTFDLIDRAG